MSSIDENTTVRELLSSYPDTFQVFLRHGMCEGCKSDPPPVPLHHFARKHCGGNITGLLDEILEAIATD